jgi:hypothetical protein
MAHMTIAQAAKHAEVDRSTISRAIKSGRLSAVILSNGKKGIDPAELERVYPSNRPIAQVRTHEKIKRAAVDGDAGLVAELHARITAQDREIEAYRERENRLLTMLETRLLTHEKPKKQQKKSTEEPETIDVEGVFRKKKRKHRKGKKKK